MWETFIGIVWDIIKFIPNVIRVVREWWNYKRPASKVFGKMLDEKREVKIFLKDFIVPNNTYSDPKLFSIEGSVTQAHPNIEKVWAEVEARGVAEILNLMGDLGKRKKLDIVEMGLGFNVWDKDMIVLGAQATKCVNFYEVMDKVAYGVNETNIYSKNTGQIIPRENGYGYGVILKANNPQMRGKGTGLLLGGYGVLGTESAIYYFVNHIEELGKLFGNKCFGVIVKARVSAGKQSVQRLKRYDIVFDR